nr:nucleotidyltransferase family protein [Pseudomonadales bacterium]
MKSVAMVPAAGQSRRMGEPKLLKHLHGEALINHTVRAWQASHISQGVIVIRANDLQLQQHLHNFLRDDLWDVVLADPPPPEMKDSILAGIDHIQRNRTMQDEDVLLMAPADMPYLDPDIINALLQTHQTKHPVILTPECQGKRGHPALLPWPFAQTVGQLESDQGLNALWNQFPNRTITVAENRSFIDLDTPA